MGPQALEAVWVNKDKAFSSTRGWQPVIGPFFDRGIMLLDFEEHRDHRRIMQQAFTRSCLNGYLELMSPAIDETLTSWQPRQDFPLYPMVKHLLLDLAAQVFVGVELGPEADRLADDFNDTVRGGQAAIRANVPGGIWARGYGPASAWSDTSSTCFPSASAAPAATCSACSHAARPMTACASPTAMW